jgi:hypothetical protein
MGTHYEGRAFAYDDNPSLPGTFAFIKRRTDQSISSVTNIDDIETYIRSMETETVRYIHIVDLPVNERQHVMQELSLMGITAGPFFPVWTADVRNCGKGFFFELANPFYPLATYRLFALKLPTGIYCRSI